MGFKRVAKEDIVLSDGFTIPKNAYICISHPAVIGLDPRPFDPFRYARTASGEFSGSSTGKARQSWYTSTDTEHMSFGHGRYACPGRFIAAVEMKLVLAAVLSNYNVAFEHNAGPCYGPEKRPKTTFMLELGFGDRTARVLMQKRSGV